DLRDHLARVLVLDRADVVAIVEDLEVELVACARLPQAERVHRVVAEPRDGCVEGNAEDVLGAGPTDDVLSLLVDPRVHPTAEADANGVFRAHELPWVAELEPLVGPLDLPAALELLLEYPEFVADPVAVAGVPQRGHRIEEARGKPSEAAIAEPGLGL